ncbi:MAG TPA: NADH-quinone oxidoreductase subunit N [Candidatus Manganitrophaceae bacterium]|nr:NADH-quinone oxidoreductase subunit N [Candidatus Manganitrophaceae bacterium]
MTPLSFADLNLTLMAPELWMTLLCCVVLSIDFIFPKFSKTGLAYLSIGGMALITLELIGFALHSVEGTLFNTMFVLDKLAIFFKIFILVSTILTILASIDYLKKIPYFRGEYYFLILFAALGMMFMASANDFLSLFITMEFSTFGFYILVAYLREDFKSNEAGIKFFILGVLAASLIAYGISLIYGTTGSILFNEIAAMNPKISIGLIVGLLFVFIGLGYKVGAVPFHTWIPDVYEGAPTPVTAYLSIVPKAAAFALFLRVVLAVFVDLQAEWQWMITWVSILSMTYGNITAIAQKNMKRLLAYSGIAQIGNILIGLAAGSKMGGDSILFYLLTYLFANIGAFVVVIIFSNLTHLDDIEDFAGLNRRSPLLAFAMLVSLLSLAGVPPLAGFVAKVYIFAAAVYQGLLLLVTVGLINVVISFYYYLIVVKKIYTLEPKETAPIPLSWPLKAALYACIAGVLILGIWPQPFIDFSVAATGVFTHLTPR